MRNSYDLHNFYAENSPLQCQSDIKATLKIYYSISKVKSVYLILKQLNFDFQEGSEVHCLYLSIQIQLITINIDLIFKILYIILLKQYYLHQSF